jgi:hypothetical protein
MCDFAFNKHFKPIAFLLVELLSIVVAYLIYCEPWDFGILFIMVLIILLKNFKHKFFFIKIMSLSFLHLMLILTKTLWTVVIVCYLV